LFFAGDFKSVGGVGGVEKTFNVFTKQEISLSVTCMESSFDPEHQLCHASAGVGSFESFFSPPWQALNVKKERSNNDMYLDNFMIRK
jgi:hypothetical protein